MKLDGITARTGVVCAGMTVGDAFRLCLQHPVSCIPFVDGNNRVTGRFSLRETLRMACIPEIAVRYADILGDDLGKITVPETFARQLLGLPVEGFILSDICAVHSSSPAVKAITLMERYEVDDAFVIDDGVYKGVVTIEAIARHLLELSDA